MFKHEPLILLGVEGGGMFAILYSKLFAEIVVQISHTSIQRQRINFITYTHIT